MFKKILATLTAVVFGVGLSLVAVAAPASAHTPNHTPSCNSLSLDFVSYENPGNTKPNTLKVYIDDMVDPVEDTTFGVTFAKTYTFSGTTSHTWKFVIDAVGGTGPNTEYDKTFTGVTTPCSYPTKSLDVQCTTVDVNWGAALGTALHVNMKVGTPSGDKTLSAYIDYNIAGGYGPNQMGIRYTDVNGVNTTAPLTEQQVKSGFFSWAYPGWLGGATSYVVKWVQMDDLHFNQSELSANWKYCNFSDVTAPLPSFTPASCDEAGTLVVPAKTGIVWAGGQNGAGPGTYNLTASAEYGFTITGQTQFEVIVPPKSSGVDCAPPCLGPDDVRYTYSNTQNLGKIFVEADPNKPGVTDLCTPFWVTATSWTFILGDKVWPQKLDVVQKLPLITKVGIYDYSAPVTCGQGDIYAAWFDAKLPDDGQPDPPVQLNGPHDPWPEHFLHDMGFEGPSPTYLQHKAGSCADLTPGDPSAGPEQCVAGVVSQGHILIVENLGKIQYTITGGQLQNPIVVADGSPNTVLPAGLYTVTAQGINGFSVGPDNTWTYEIEVKKPVACEKVTIPVSTMQQSACVANLPVGTYTLPATTYVEWWVDGVKKTTPENVIGTKNVVVEARITAAAQALGIVFSDGTLSNSKTHIFVSPAEGCDPPILALMEPNAFPTPGTCTAPPSYTLSNTTSEHGGVQWKFGDPLVNTTPGTHEASWGTTVKVEATAKDPVNDGFALETQTKWTFTFPAKPTACGDLVTLALTGATGGFVLWIAGAMLLLGGAGVYFTRRHLASQK